MIRLSLLALVSIFVFTASASADFWHHKFPPEGGHLPVAVQCISLKNRWHHAGNYHNACRAHHHHCRSNPIADIPCGIIKESCKKVKEHHHKLEETLKKHCKKFHISIK